MILADTVPASRGGGWETAVCLLFISLSDISALLFDKQLVYSRAESCDSSPASTPPLSRTNSRDSSPFLSRRNSGDKDSLARGDRAPKLNLLEERLREEFGSGVFLYR